MDLTKEYPRSVHEKMAGVVMLARATDKAKGKAAGTVGEYNYSCPMDRGVFGFLGIDPDQYLDIVRNAKSDAEIEAYARQFVSKKTPAEIEEFNRTFVTHAPEPGSEGEKYFLELRNSVAPNRTDVKYWADLLDLDEKRPVPERVPA
jgi:Domain of unknown function (DUF5069)